MNWVTSWISLNWIWQQCAATSTLIWIIRFRQFIFRFGFNIYYALSLFRRRRGNIRFFSFHMIVLYSPLWNTAERWMRKKREKENSDEKKQRQKSMRIYESWKVNEHERENERNYIVPFHGLASPFVCSTHTHTHNDSKAITLCAVHTVLPVEARLETMINIYLGPTNLFSSTVIIR